MMEVSEASMLLFLILDRMKLKECNGSTCIGSVKEVERSLSRKLEEVEVLLHIALASFS